jgi:SPP1 gp7 family putative phage head morphogenesis protein
LNKREKEFFLGQLESEKAVLNALKRQYEKALEDITERIKVLQSDELTQSRIYRIDYQKALKAQVEAILDKLQADEYETIHQYLSSSYTDGYVGTMYAMSGQGVTVLTPIDQKAAVKAIVTDSELKAPLYDTLGIDMKTLKRKISEEITRGIAQSLPYKQIARNITNKTNMPLSNAKRIVRTEAHRIQEASADDARYAAKKRGADVVKQWDGTLDSKTRPLHRRLDGQIRELDEPFEAGGYTAMYPGGFGVAAQDCNCRCVALTRARWAIDEDEINILKERAKFFGLDKTRDFSDYKQKYLKAVKKEP